MNQNHRRMAYGSRLTDKEKLLKYCILGEKTITLQAEK
jgi:hypothetical protein